MGKTYIFNLKSQILRFVNIGTLACSCSFLFRSIWNSFLFVFISFPINLKFIRKALYNIIHWMSLKIRFLSELFLGKTFLNQNHKFWELSSCWYKHVRLSIIYGWFKFVRQQRQFIMKYTSWWTVQLPSNIYLNKSSYLKATVSYLMSIIFFTLN